MDRADILDTAIVGRWLSESLESLVSDGAAREQLGAAMVEAGERAAEIQELIRRDEQTRVRLAEQDEISGAARRKLGALLAAYSAMILVLILPASLVLPVPSAGYFGVISAVIPTMFVAVAVESVGLRQITSDCGLLGRVSVAALLMTIMAAELSALFLVARVGPPTPFAFALTLAALLATTSLVISGVFAKP